MLACGRQPIVSLRRRADALSRACSPTMVETTGQPMYVPSLSDDGLPPRECRHRVVRRPCAAYPGRMDDVSTTATDRPCDDAGADAAPGTGGQAGSEAGRADVVQLLGLIAFTELATFTRLAAVAAGAPTPTQHLHLVRLAGAALDRQERILRRITELGADADAEMLQFTGTFDDYDSRTESQTWWEDVLKGYVGNGVADDFCRIAVDGLDEPTRAVVVEVLDDTRNAELSVAVLGEAAGADTVLASRLALWGRRLVGESLGLVQQLLGAHPALGRLVAEGARRRLDTAEADQAWVFSQLTAEHTRRMGRLGLAA